MQKAKKHRKEKNIQKGVDDAMNSRKICKRTGCDSSADDVFAGLFRPTAERTFLERIRSFHHFILSICFYMP